MNPAMCERVEVCWPNEKSIFLEPLIYMKISQTSLQSIKTTEMLK